MISQIKIIDHFCLRYIFTFSILFISFSFEPVLAQDGYSFDAGSFTVGKKTHHKAEDGWVGGNLQKEQIGKQQEDSGIKAEVFVPAPRPPRPRQIILDEVDKARISTALKARKQLLKEQEKYNRKVKATDPRGEPELRVCNISTEGYGIPEEVKRINRVSFPGFKSREKYMVQLVKEKGCDLIALQGAIGKDHILIDQGLSRLKDKLEEATGRQWRIYTGSSNHKLTTHAFLINERVGAVSQFRSFADYKFPVVKGFELEQFYRGPIMMEFSLTGDRDKTTRKISVFSFHFGKNVSRERKGLIKDWLQMAEAVRLIAMRSREESVVIVMGDTLGPKYSAQNFVLSGRLSLAEFEEGGSCLLERNSKFKCESKYKNPILLSVTDLQLAEPKTKIYKKEDKQIRYIDKKEVELMQKLQQSRWMHTPGIYMFSEDIPLAYKWDQGEMMTLNVAEESIPTAPLEAPFLWMELNW